MTPKPIDFAKVEELRKHMLVHTGDWAKLMGVSRMTYYKWVSGKAQMRPSKDTSIRVQIRCLLAVLTNGWPTPEDKGLDYDKRVAKLLALLDQPQ